MKITQAIRTWRTHVLRSMTLKIEPSACPMHGQTCAHHYDESVRAALRELHGAMYELFRDEPGADAESPTRSEGRLAKQVKRTRLLV